MIQTSQFNCSECGVLIDIGEPFLASATFPSRSYMDSSALNAKYLQEQGEVLCQKCSLNRLGATQLSKLKGTVFTAMSQKQSAHKQKNST